MSFLTYLYHVLSGNRGLSGLSLREHWGLYSQWRTMNKSGMSPLGLELPWITLIAVRYIQKYVADGRGDLRVFEYGSGGSSAFFHRKATELVSIEHDEKWASEVTRWKADHPHASWSYQFIPPEKLTIPPIRLDPSDPALYQSEDPQFADYSFFKYVSFIDRYADSYFDIVLVDGRSRPSCLRHAAKKVKKGGTLILDNAERDYYLKQSGEWIKDYSLVHSSWGALVATWQFTRTNIYRRK